MHLKFKLMNSMGKSPAAREWKQLMVEEILLERRKKVAAKKKEAEVEEAHLKKKRT